MKNATRRLGLVVAVFGLMAGEARAVLVYSSGPINGTINADPISDPVSVSNSFTVSVDTMLTNAIVGLWVNVGDTPTTLEWSIGATAFGSNVASGSARLTNTFHNYALGSYSVYESSFPLSGSLTSGTYWLTLSKASLTPSAPGTSFVFWDQNDGSSSALLALGSLSGPIPSQAFQLYGDAPVSAVPEPSTIALVCTALPIGLGFAWKRRRKAVTG